MLHIIINTLAVLFRNKWPHINILGETGLLLGVGLCDEGDGNSFWPTVNGFRHDACDLTLGVWFGCSYGLRPVAVLADGPGMDLNKNGGTAAMSGYRVVSTRLVVAILATCLAAVYTVVNLAAYDWNPSIFLAVGEEAPPAPYVSAVLGTDVDMRPGPGHDGQYCFVTATDPLLIDSQIHLNASDRPTYRSQRILFPLVASAFGLLEGWAVAWGLLGLSVLTFGVGTYLTAMVAEGMGGSAWWGLAFAFNLGVISELLVGGGGHFALAFGMGAVAAVQRSRFGWSVVLLSLAALSREATLLFAAGVAVWLWSLGRRRLAVLHMAAPVLFAGLWAVYVRIRLGSASGVTEVEEFGLPFQGLVEAARLWPTDGLNLVAGVVVLVLLTMFVIRMIREPWLVGWAAVGFVPVAILFTRPVWFSYFDITRAVSPVITAYLLMAFAARGTARLEREAVR